MVAGAGLNAGLVAERRTGTDLIGLAADASVKVCGVAIDDIAATAPYSGAKKVGDGHEMTVYSGGWVPVVCAANVTAGQTLCAAASGQVRPWVTGTDVADSIIGYADAAASSGAVVLMFIKAGGH